MKDFPAYLGGHWRATSDRRLIRSPFAGSEVATVSFCGPAELDAALDAAVKAAPAAAALGSWERAAICRTTSDGLRARADESGKPLAEARAEVERAVHTFEIAAAEAERIYGDVIPMDLRQNAADRWGVT